MPDEKMKDGYKISPRMEMEYLPRKIAVPEGGEAKQSLVITKHHLDTNHHVNNGQYVHIALEYPEEDFVIRRLRAEYKKQAYLGDTFYPTVCRRDDVYTISLNDEKGQPYAVVELTGERKQDGE